MPVENIPVELIDDNPFNPRTHYPTKKISELAESIERIGLQEPLKGRQIDGRYQLAFGSLRKRAYEKLAKKAPEKWATMPVEVQQLSDDEMFVIAIEENLKRVDLKPIEVARGIDAFLTKNPDISEVKLASALGMTQGAVSNMRRVIALPLEILEKVDEEVINFHMARELLILSGPDAVELMREAISKLKTGSRSWGQPPTVQGIIHAIAEVASNHFKALEKNGSWRGNSPLFDTKEAGCLSCEKMVAVHPTQKETSHYCTSKECWEKKQQEHRDKVSTGVKAKMETEVLHKAAAEASLALLTPNYITIVDKSFLEEKVKPSCSADTIAEKGSKVRNPFLHDGKRWICTGSAAQSYDCYQLVKPEEWPGETRSYSVPQGREHDEYYESLRNDPNGFYHGMLVTWGKSQCVLVGPEITFTEAISQEIPEVKGEAGDVIQLPSHVRFKMSSKAGDVIHALHTGQPVEISRLIEAVLPPPGVRWAEDVPKEECEKCKLDTEDHTVDFSFPTPSKSASDGVAYRKVCLKDYRAVMQEQTAEMEEVKQSIPADILALAREKAGTRAEVLDIHEMMPPTHTILKRKFGGIIDALDSPDECIERCTTGFHYAFDSADNDESQICYVCTNSKCLAQKKGAKTRAEHAEGLGKKQAETKAIKAALKVIEESPEKYPTICDEVITGTAIAVTRAALKLVILAQLEGKHLANYCGNWKKPSKWIWDEVNAGTAEDKRSEEALWQILDNMSERELTMLVVKMMFYYLTDSSSDIGRYEIKAAEPLQWFGIDVKQYLKES
jgi:ParB/RepB/Spo0J family partition protein